MTTLLVLSLSLLLARIPAILCTVTTANELTVLEGQSLTIPCHYEPQYAAYVKYWCRGAMREFCTSLARTDATGLANPAEDKVSIADDQVQLVSAVTMNNLKEEDSGWYMCGVEVGSGWTADVVTYIHISVIHGLSVVHNQVSGEEGSSVTVECLYSERYRESEKKWCRSGDWSSCLPTGPEGSYEDASVALSDDRIRTFTVTLKKLKLSDTAWYMCSVGTHQLAVLVQVTPRPTTTRHHSSALCVTSLSSAAASVTSPFVQSQAVAPRSFAKQSWTGHSHILEPLLACCTLMLLVITLIFAWKLWKLQRPQYPILQQVPVLRPVTEEKAGIGDVGDLQNTAVILQNKEMLHLYQV